MGAVAVGAFDEIRYAKERRRMLEDLTVKQLKEIAAKFDVDVRPKEGLAQAWAGESNLSPKELLVARLDSAIDKLPYAKLKKHFDGLESGPTQSPRRSHSESVTSVVSTR